MDKPPMILAVWKLLYDAQDACEQVDTVGRDPKHAIRSVRISLGALEITLKQMFGESRVSDAADQLMRKFGSKNNADG